VDILNEFLNGLVKDRPVLGIDGAVVA
jgi:hypothetical protein